MYLYKLIQGDKMNLDEMKSYGVEVEFLSHEPRGFIASRITQATGIDVRLASYSDKNHNQWRIKTDSSVQGRGNGYELVTPILRGEEDMIKLRDVVNVIKEYGEINSSCGLHVHIGVNELDAAQYRKLLKLWLKYEYACDLLLPESRRTANRYCNRNFQYIYRSCEEATFGAQLVDCFGRLNTRKNHRALVGSRGRGFSFGDKYTKLNTGHFWNQGTIEFRSHSGTLNKDKIDHWVRLTQAFVMAAATCRGTNINKNASSFDCRTYIMLRDFYKKGLIDKATVKFYKKRYKELNNEVCR
tara:strand:- start:292 stop:1188 length:897 start_codon:yes stop_codon:yes gene_type:complete